MLQAIRSVLNQTFRDFEVIVIDDGSTDDTRHVVSALRNRIRYIYQHNKGLASARNTGIKASDGEYIAFLDADDIWEPQKLESQVEVMKSHPEVGLVYAAYSCIDEEDRIILRSINRNKPTGKILRELFLWSDINSSTVLVRKECFSRVGLFDENPAIKGGCEDWDLWLRIARHYEFYFLERSLVRYRQTASSVHRKTESMKKARIYVLKKAFSDSRLLSEIIDLKDYAYSSAHFDIGVGYYASRKMRKARKEFMQAIKLYPYQAKLYLYFVKCFLGSKLISLLTDSKNKILFFLRKTKCLRPHETQKIPVLRRLARKLKGKDPDYIYGGP